MTKQWSPEIEIVLSAGLPASRPDRPMCVVCDLRNRFYTPEEGREIIGRMAAEGAGYDDLFILTVSGEPIAPTLPTWFRPEDLP